MKKVLSLIVPVLLFSAMAYGQRTMKTTTTLNAPLQGATITVGTQFPFEFEVKNDGPDMIAVGDTLLYTFTGTQSVFYRVLAANKPVGDTIIVSTGLTFSQATNGSLTFCASAVITNGVAVNYDTTGGNYVDCNTVTITGGNAVSVENIVKLNDTKSEKISIYPNPAVGNTINLDYIAKNASEVAVNVYDLAGRKVLSQNFGKAFKGQEGYGIDISSLTGGMYMLELRQDGVKATGQFIK